MITVSHAFAAYVSRHCGSLGGVLKTLGRGLMERQLPLCADKAPEMQSL